MLKKENYYYEKIKSCNEIEKNENLPEKIRIAACFMRIRMIRKLFNLLIK